MEKWRPKKEGFMEEIKGNEEEYKIGMIRDWNRLIEEENKSYICNNHKVEGRIDTFLSNIYLLTSKKISFNKCLKNSYLTNYK